MFAPQHSQPAGDEDDYGNQALHHKLAPRTIPPPILVYQNVPMENRARLDITPADPKWKEMLAYFNTLLRKFLPTIDEPHAKWQQEDTELFRRTLETRFKGVMPTLAMKMTMLYFGCPVAPMKFGRNQYVTSGDLDEPEEEVHIERDPLDFLGCYKERSYGLPPTVTYIPIGPALTEEDTYSPSMRGGFLEDDDMELVESESQCDEDMDSQSEDGSAVALGLRGGSGSASRYIYTGRTTEVDSTDIHSSFRMYSRQGQADVAEGYAGLAQGVIRLLSLNVAERDVQLVFTIIGTRSERGEVKATVNTPIEVPPPGAEGALSDILERIQDEEDPKVFVRRASDVAPSTFEPKPLEGGIATITYKDADDLERIGYLRTSRRPNLNHSVTNYATSYQHTLHALIGSHHQWITFPEVRGAAGPVKVYSCEDIPQQLISSIATHTYCSIKADVERIDRNIVPVILSDSQSHYTSNAIELFRQNLGDLEALNRVVQHALSRLPGRRKIADGIHVFFPGEDYQDINTGHVFIGLDNGRATEGAFNAWVQKIGTCKYENPAGISLVVQPWFEIYIVSAPQSMQSAPNYQPFNVRLAECNLQLFKLRVAKDLYPGNYDPQDKEHTLILEDEIRSSRHVITYESTEEDWQRMLRRLMCQNLEVTLKTKDRDARWNVDENSYWGPSYYRALLNYIPSGNPYIGNANNPVKNPGFNFNPTPSNIGSNGSVRTFGTSRSQEIADNLYKTYQSRLSDFMAMKGSDNSMRDLTLWETPSIFTNPAKPVMPLHGPPLESVIRTGPDVPSITLGMRTATETARLEREVHSLRGHLLDRIRDCPYIDCDQRFSYMDMVGFERHIKYEHKVLQCALCIAFKPCNGRDIDIDRSLMYMDREQITVHIAQEHADHLKMFISVPEGKGPTAWDKATAEQKEKTQQVLFPFCSHCGREEKELKNPEDVFHHHLTCRGSNAENRQNLVPGPFCKVCGQQAVPNSFGQLVCTDGTCKSHTEKGTCSEDFCAKCGFDLSGCSQEYRAIHDQGCRLLPGGSWSGSMEYCPFCGISLNGLENEEREQHVWECNRRPSPKPTKCPICVASRGSDASVTPLYTPQEVLQHLETVHGGSTHCPWCKQQLVGKATNTEFSVPAKHYHFAQHMGQVSPCVRTEVGIEEVGGNANGISDIRCPLWFECGAIMNEMSQAQWNRHMQLDHPTYPFLPNGMPDLTRTVPPTNYGKHVGGGSRTGSSTRGKHVGGGSGVGSVGSGVGSNKGNGSSASVHSIGNQHPPHHSPHVPGTHGVTHPTTHQHPPHHSPHVPGTHEVTHPVPPVPTFPTTETGTGNHHGSLKYPHPHSPPPPPPTFPTTETGTGNNHGRKRPHHHTHTHHPSPTLPTTETGTGGNHSTWFGKETWGTSIIDTGSDSSYENREKRRKVASEEKDPDEDYKTSQDVEEPPEEYIDTGHDSDTGGALGIGLGKGHGQGQSPTTATDDFDPELMSILQRLNEHDPSPPPTPTTGTTGGKRGRGDWPWGTKWAPLINDLAVPARPSREQRQVLERLRRETEREKPNLRKQYELVHELRRISEALSTGTGSQTKSVTPVPTKRPSPGTGSQTKSVTPVPTEPMPPGTEPMPPGIPYIVKVTPIVRPGQALQQQQYAEPKLTQEEMDAVTRARYGPIGPRGPGEPYIAAITPIKRPSVLPPLPPAVATSIEEEEEEGAMPKATTVTGTRSSTRNVRPTAAKLESEAAKAATTSTASKVTSGGRGRTPAKAPAKSQTKTTTTGRTTRSASQAIEAPVLPTPTGQEPPTPRTTRGSSPAKRGRSRK
ncbi:hypothetical protein PG993_015228 [Apiospora rasikravindrae]|uniref:C2H2-type domain-containing protein n=1 Tax=Apiospora rasikravindrae TaxID=990691 RepID=A0ABR1RPY7_9PEZI